MAKKIELSEEIIAEIKELAQQGLSLRKIAETVGTNKNKVSLILKGQGQIIGTGTVDKDKDVPINKDTDEDTVRIGTVPNISTDIVPSTNTSTNQSTGTNINVTDGLLYKLAEYLHNVNPDLMQGQDGSISLSIHQDKNGIKITEASYVDNVKNETKTYTEEDITSLRYELAEKNKEIQSLQTQLKNDGSNATISKEEHKRIVEELTEQNDRFRSQNGSQAYEISKLRETLELRDKQVAALQENLRDVANIIPSKVSAKRSTQTKSSSAVNTANSSQKLSEANDDDFRPLHSKTTTNAQKTQQNANMSSTQASIDDEEWGEPKYASKYNSFKSGKSFDKMTDKEIDDYIDNAF